MDIEGALVSTDWLAKSLERPNLRVFDTTVYLQVMADGTGYQANSGHGAWAQAHIPGAGFMDLIEEFSDNKNSTPFMMPPAREFCDRAAKHGIGDDSLVVLYNDGLPMWSTRAWWMFRSVGFDNVVVLDGGWKKWQREGRPTNDDTPNHAPSNLSSNPRPQMWVDKNDMLEIVKSGGACTLNALSPDVYSGRINRYGRPGHIPSSHNVFYDNLVDPDTGTFLSQELLLKQFAVSGSLEAERVVIYCGGGISATMDALALHIVGHNNIAIYDGSMSEWIKDELLPLELGDTP
ncbi:MAG TPA: sulfurtransferase [Gammaproteobacteria bacterium]|nr:sulfurtransferase [Gammaproteobacteria bacterium]|tara:strand:- start:549 stop:1421 length:873 start_codon:yes stop_codon:yes gene_type:complete